MPQAIATQPPPETIADLMAMDLAALPLEEALQAASILIDLGDDAGDAAALDRAAGVLDHLQANEGLPPGIGCRVHYCRANIWSAGSPARRTAGSGNRT